MANEATKLTIGGVQHDIMDAEARRLIALLQEALDAMTGTDTTIAIETFQEVINFLDGVTDDETLVGKITALQTAIDGKVGKVTGKGLSTNDYTTAEKQKLAGLSNYNDSALQTAVTNLQTALANVYTKAQTDSAIQEAVEGLGGGAVSVTTNQDGTFTIHVGETDYNVNLNHTHEGMAKLVKCTEATLPDELADDTIYVQVDDASNPTEIESLYLFGLEFTGGGSVPGVPTLTSPSNGSTINVGTNTGSGVTKTLRVKGRSLTQTLTVAMSGTGFSVDVNSISASDANLGVNIVITYNGMDANASGTLLISSSEVTVQCDVSAAYENPYETMGVQFDKAIDHSIVGDGIRTAPGYCISPVLTVAQSHQYRVCFGFKGSGTTATYGLGVYDLNGGKLAVYTADSADSDGVREFTLSYSATTALCTFLSSKIDDCYVYDKTTGDYLFKGLNVQ